MFLIIGLVGAAIAIWGTIRLLHKLGSVTHPNTALEWVLVGVGFICVFGSLTISGQIAIDKLHQEREAHAAAVAKEKVK